MKFRNLTLIIFVLLSFLVMQYEGFWIGMGFLAMCLIIWEFFKKSRYRRRRRPRKGRYHKRKRLRKRKKGRRRRRLTKVIWPGTYDDW